jgi:hypothetical protein
MPRRLSDAAAESDSPEPGGLPVIRSRVPETPDADAEDADLGSEDEKPASPAEAAQLASLGLVGSLVWTLRKGDLWVLAPESAFLFTDCWRKTLLREAWMLDRESSPRQKYLEGNRKFRLRSSRDVR